MAIKTSIMHNVVKNLKKYNFVYIAGYKYLESNLAKYNRFNENVFSNFTHTHTHTMSYVYKYLLFVITKIWD